MALIKCNECGGKVSSKAKTCPHCGAKVPQTSAAAVVGLLVGAMFVSYVIIYVSDQDYSNSSGASYYPGPTTTAQPATKTANAQSKAWYEGGNLHKATADQWLNASYENRLATSADFVTTLMQADGMAIPPVDDLFGPAVYMEQGITHAVKNAPESKPDVAQIGPMVWVYYKADAAQQSQ